MPLTQSASKPAIAGNIVEMMNAGHPRDQAIAAALNTARKVVKHKAHGGQADDERLKRAKAQGFDTSKVWYHSSLGPVDRFKPHGKFMGRSGVGGIHLTDNPEAANRFLDRYGDYDWQHKPFQKNVVPVYVKHGKTLRRDERFPTNLPLGAPLPKDYKSPIEQAGYDALLRNDSINKRGKDVWHDPKPGNALKYQELILHDPSRIRSTFAQFNDDEAVPELSRQTGGRAFKAGGGRVHLHTGPIHSAVAGRTDHLPMNVPHGAYVLPADIVSGMGQGNTMAGFKIAKQLPSMFSASFYGQQKAGAGAPYGATGLPYYGPSPQKAAGGGLGRSEHDAEDVGDDQGVPIVAAGGEHVYHPSEVRRIGNGDLDRGHRILDSFVTTYRDHLRQTLRDLPGPKRD